MNKFCTKCQSYKDFIEFNKNKSKKDGLSSYCKECSKLFQSSYYLSNKDKWNKQRNEIKKRNIEYIKQVLEANSCKDCGESNIVVLEFDHLSDKKYNISEMRNCSLSLLKQEIEKCEVVCANCHKKRTAKQFSWWKIA